MKKLSKINETLNKIEREFNGFIVVDSTKTLLEKLNLTSFEFQNIKTRLKKLSAPKLERKEKTPANDWIYFTFAFQSKRWQCIAKIDADISFKNL